MLIEYDFTLEHINLSTCHDLSGEPLGQNLLCSRGASFSLLRKIPARKITSRCPTFCLRSHILRASEIKRGARARGTHTHGNTEEVAYDEEPPGDSNYALFSFSGAEKFCPSVRNLAPTPQGCKIAPAVWPNGRLVGLHVQGNYGRVPCMHAAAMPPTSRPDRRVVAAKSED
jgi:hypothetical protein